MSVQCDEDENGLMGKHLSGRFCCRRRRRIRMIRLMNADEIECRVGTIGVRGLSLLLYKDARVDQRILDETFTPFGWRRTHQEIGGKLFCTVDVWDAEKKQWISKQDIGTESIAEKEKGQASDSFKRACFNWGIGRELYSAPFIWIPAEKVEISYDGKRYATTDRFHVQSIAYDEKREIAGLVICNSKGLSVYKMHQQKNAVVNEKLARTPEQAKVQLSKKMRGDLEKELQRTGVSMETVLARYNLSDISQMLPEHYRDAMSGLRKSKPVAA